ncbi:hypothetical protein BurJ1DRAFT_0409 [Burkholderiales bacterium JOSHI_001]|nr:hypothetical protein BurJ1DRAFT_0409 [Burkholderiales bacterium JOSHI_001]
MEVGLLWLSVALLIVQTWRVHRGAGAVLLPNLLAGAALVAALRCALTPGLLLPAPACLGAAGVCHVVDLRQRLGGARAARGG